MGMPLTKLPNGIETYLDKDTISKLFANHLLYMDASATIRPDNTTTKKWFLFKDQKMKLLLEPETVSKLLKLNIIHEVYLEEETQ